MSFQVTSGRLQITDPEFDVGVWCTATLDNVRNGTYHSTVTREDQGVWGDRITQLEIYHDSVKNKRKRLKYHWRDSNIGVDSGKAGIFDYQKYKQVKEQSFASNEFNNQMTEFTYSVDHHENLDFGTVASSGFGDGVYSVYVAEDNNEVVAVKIVFIVEDNDDYSEI